MDISSVVGPDGLSPSQLGGAVFAVVFIGLIIRSYFSPVAKVPGPWYTRWTEIVSKIHFIRGEGPIYVQRLHEKYGPTVRLGPSSVDVTDANSVRLIHRVNSDFVKAGYYKSLSEHSLDLFNVVDKEEHRRRRKLLSQPVSENGLKPMLPQIESRVRLAVQRMGEEMKTRGAADVYKWWMFMTTDVIGELSFGDSFRTLERGKKDAYSEDVAAAGNQGVFFGTFPSLLKLGALLRVPAIKVLMELEGRLGSYAAKSLQRYRETMDRGENQPMLFSGMMGKDKNGDRLSDEEIENEARLFIVAGSDTTSNTLTYFVWEVCRNPEIRDRLVREVQSLPSDFTDRDVQKLPYFDQCLQETLRRWPVAPAALPRVVPKGGAVLDGFWLPGDTVVSTQNYSLHRNKEAFPDPEKFDPSRWESPTKAMRENFLAFGGGSRVCIGMHLANIEMRLGIAHFFRTFPRATVSQLEGMCDADMKQALYFIAYPSHHRCLIAES
ncbi:cytochrome P450 [Xylariomycetidae sp. FL2044]|nr:cytochrome P450 [Xylariomycetidae sp. FL2044]